jgi:hypothetical protein
MYRKKIKAPEKKQEGDFLTHMIAITTKKYFDR